MNDLLWVSVGGAPYRRGRNMPYRCQLLGSEAAACPITI